MFPSRVNHPSYAGIRFGRSGEGSTTVVYRCRIARLKMEGLATDLHISPVGLPEQIIRLTD